MKIDILNSVEALVIPRKNKEVKSENNFKDILANTTSSKNQKDEIISSEKSKVEKEVNSTEDIKREATKENEDIRTDSYHNKEFIEIEKFNEENLLNKKDFEVIEELMALIMGVNEIINKDLKALNEIINKDLKSLIEESGLDFSINETNKELINRLFIAVESGNELIGKNNLQELINSLKVIEFVEKDNFLGNTDVKDILDKLVEDLEKVNLVLENTSLLKENKEIRNEIKKFIESGKYIIENLSQINIPKDNSLSLEGDNTLEGGEFIVTSKEDEIINKKAETSFNDKENGNKEFSAAEKEELVLNKILGHEIKEQNLFIPNKILAMNSENIGELKETINIKSFSVDTVKSMKYMVNNSIKELVVKVNPGNLGDVTIKISMAGNEVKANISTASKELYNYINSDEIKNMLNQENIKVSEVNISLYQEDTTFFKEGSEFNSRENQGREGTFNKREFNTLEEGIVEEVKDLSSLDIIV